MTLNEIRDELWQIAEHPGDNEIDHGRADALLCMAIRMLGHADIANAFELAKQNFWYA